MKSNYLKLIVSVVMLLITAFSFAQSPVEKALDSTINELKKNSGTDPSDSRIFDLLQNFYEEALQADKGDLSQKTIQNVNDYVSDATMKNRHMLLLFLTYQQHINQAASKGDNPDSEYQVACIKLLEKEMMSIYKKVPAIVYIYKAEAFQSHGLIEEAKAIIVSALKIYPSSIPLKVYRYLDTKDESLKNDLVKNHSAHWLVQQNGIR